MAKKGKTVAKSTSFKRDVVVLASGTIAGQVLTLLASPFISRLFDSEAFGIFALVNSITMVLVVISTLKYEAAVVLPERDADAASLTAGALAISLLFSALVFPALWLLGPTLADWLNAPSLVSYIWVVPFLVFFGGFGSGHQVVNAWAARTRRFAQIAKTRTAGLFVTNAAKLAAGFAGFTSAGGLVAGSTAGSIFGPLLLGWQVWREDRELFWKSVRLPKLWRNLSRYRKFAIYNTPSSLLGSLSTQLPSFLLAFFFSPAVVGFYSFGHQLLRIPMDLIGTSIAQAFYPHAAAANRQRELASFVAVTFRRLVEYSLFPSLMLALTGRELFSVVFGSHWAEAGVYTQILSLWMLFWFISIPLSQLINILEKNEFFIRWNVVTLITRVGSIWLGGYYGSPRLALAIFSVSGACIYAYISYWVSLKAGVPWTQITRMMLKNSVIFAPAGGTVLLFKFLSFPELAIAAIAVLFTGFYFLYRVKDESIFRSALARVRGLL